MDIQKEILIMSLKELDRFQIVEKVLGCEINQQEAASVLEISDRQVRRIVRRVRNEGVKGLIHRLRGKAGNRKIKEGMKQRVLGIYRKIYGGFGPRLASEKLLERDKIKVNEETLRLWLIEEGLWRPKKQRKVKKRSWRERKDHVGEMVQMDGSHHDWLEGRGPKMVLMGYIDDATGRMYGRFYDYEGTQPAMDSLKRYIRRDGIPRIIYLDKHSTYKVNGKQQRYKDWPFRDQEELTQFARACRQLGIELVYANSPQAKGRIERVFRTLQDRLVKELRLARARTLEEANSVLRHYLPKFNKQFNVIAKQPGDLHKAEQGVDLDDVLSIQTEHVLRNDRTLVHQKQWYQVKNRTRAKKVVVHEDLKGRITIRNKDHRLQYTLIEKIPEKVKHVCNVKPRKIYRPPKGSYWRNGFKLPGSLKN
jgi:transposase/ribosomal protein L21